MARIAETLAESVQRQKKLREAMQTTSKELEEQKASTPQAPEAQSSQKPS